MNSKIKMITTNGFIAALYVVFTLAIAPFAFGQIQFRITEVLVLICFFRKDYAFGLTIGCAIANIFSEMGIVDVAFGSLATLLACLGIMFSKHLVVAIFFPIIANAFIVGAELYFVLGLPFWINVLYVGIGEFGVMVIGYVAFMLLKRSSRFMDLIGATQNREFKF